MFNDHLVEEVRAIREKLAAECDFDIHKICEQARQEQARSNAVIVDYSRRLTKAAEEEPSERKDDPAKAVGA